MNRPTPAFFSLSLAATLGTTTVACSTDSTLTIENQSSIALLSIYLSPVSQASWGRDLLGAELLSPGQYAEISGIDCDTYDVRVVDEDLDECIVTGLDLCLDHDRWVIDDATLIDCQF